MPEGPKLQPEWLSQGPGFLEKRLPTPSHQLGGLRESCKLPHGVQGEAPADQNFFGIFTVQRYALHGI